MLGYYAIYASPEGQKMIRAIEAGEDLTDRVPDQIDARTAAAPRDGSFLSAFLHHATRMA